MFYGMIVHGERVIICKEQGTRDQGNKGTIRQGTRKAGNKGTRRQGMREQDGRERGNKGLREREGRELGSQQGGGGAADGREPGASG
jgi:hypothetical protein